VPLLHFNGTPRAFEATWKYLLVGGTGIALSLLGSFCLGYASLHGGGSGDLTFTALTAQGAGLSRPWVLTAWVLLLVGYGTKMGLAPMHTWKPDAYGEAPGIVGAMLAGGVTTWRSRRHAARARGGRRGGGGRGADRTLLASDCSRCWWPRCSCWARAISSGCWPIRASSTWASSASARRSAARACGRRCFTCGATA
jgi:hydrogenase-4 component F